ncbi:MAG: tetratricopeptide repeat protein [Bacteroidales bacterium]|nr:tetratricopeptide repeat protein [Bacteroidales bacterium]
MNNGKLLISNFFIIFISISLSAQPNIDSLQNVLRNSQTDTAKTRILLDLSWRLKSDDGNKAKEYANEALKLARKTNDTKSQATALKTIGIVNLFQGDYDKSEQFHKDALALFLALNYAKGISACYNNLGIIHELKGEFAKAVEQYKYSLEINKKINNQRGIASCYSNLGNIFQQRGNYRQSINYYLDALKIFEFINDTESAGDIYNNIGGLNEKLQETNTALKNYQKALILYIKSNTRDKMSNSLINIGRVLSTKGEYSKSIEYYLQALELRKNYGSKKGIASTYLNLGEVYLNMEKYNQAFKYINQSLTTYKEIDVKTGVCDAYNLLGEYYRKTGKFKKATEQLKNAIKAAKEIGYKPSLQDSYELLSTVYADWKKFPKAYEYRLLYELMTDSLTNEKNSNNITELQMQYEFEKSLKEHDLQNKIDKIQTKEALKKQKIISWALITGLIFILIIVFIIYRAYKRKQKDNLLLQKQKDEINNINEELKTYQEELISQKEHLIENQKIIENNLNKISKQNQKITDSIQYALRIQTALLPEENLFAQAFSDYFILNMPKDIVSGDFYWLKIHKNKIYIAVADSTGHGVPGAFMSLIGISFLNEIIKNNENHSAAGILNQLRNYLKSALNRNDTGTKTGDGIDIALCIIDTLKKEIQYAGAYNPLIIINNRNELSVVKADKMPIGKHHKEKNSFTNNRLTYSDGDRFYLFTDGYLDQFGGVQGRKFLMNNFKDLLLKICNLPMQEQKNKLVQNFNNWKEEYEQVDDILIIGFKPVN